MGDVERSLIRHFEYSHLPEHLQAVTRGFHYLAHHLLGALPNNSERLDALSQLLLAKESALRSVSSDMQESH